MNQTIKGELIHSINVISETRPDYLGMGQERGRVIFKVPSNGTYYFVDRLMNGQHMGLQEALYTFIYKDGLYAVVKSPFMPGEPFWAYVDLQGHSDNNPLWASSSTVSGAVALLGAYSKYLESEVSKK